MTGDPEGLAGAYDRYGDSLYKYCRSLLGDPADAAEAVRDTFVTAATWTGGLGDLDRSPARLYAVARAESLLALRAGKPQARDETGESAAAGSAGGAGGAGAESAGGGGAAGGAAAGEDAEAGGSGEDAGAGGARGSAGAGIAGPRTLLQDACQGLGSADREVIELHLWHGLEAAEIATVLGVRGHRANRLLSRASDQLEACLDVLLVGRAGSAGCPSSPACWSAGTGTSLRRCAGGRTGTSGSARPAPPAARSSRGRPCRPACPQARRWSRRRCRACGSRPGRPRRSKNTRWRWLPGRIPAPWRTGPCCSAGPRWRCGMASSGRCASAWTWRGRAGSTRGASRGGCGRPPPVAWCLPSSSRRSWWG